ncbi:hypothetical protein SADUNF_Sadunf06G0108300 [Salix dunnii]|uniref:L-ascorbate peroxidase n=1 Tax=Salix dunnii TaxID=1413687 RepID=A0A835MX99_9ROSI|nr:hypothetical protein SADUNF_Sadunf06G0108300 [Salix dunnii]
MYAFVDVDGILLVRLMSIKDRRTVFGTIRHPDELAHGANSGLDIAARLLEPIKEQFPILSFRMQLIKSVLCLLDHKGNSMEKEIHCCIIGLPCNSLLSRLDVFDHMGLSDTDIVALSGGHTLGRCHKECSGLDVPWTPNPLVFDNSYFKELLSGEKGLIQLPSDKTLLEDPFFCQLVEKYAEISVKITGGFQRPVIFKFFPLDSGDSLTDDLKPPSEDKR